MIKKTLWGLMTLSAILVALYALAILFAPSIRPTFVQNLFAHFPKVTAIHFFGGAVAIVTGAIQFNASLRRKHLPLHKILGRFYVVSILCAGIASFILAVNSVGGIYVQSGFGLMAICWLATTINAYCLIRRSDVSGHERWMTRSYAVTLAGVTLRLYLGLSVVLEIKFIDAYPVLAWICWIPNLIIAELVIRFKANKRRLINERALPESC